MAKEIRFSYHVLGYKASTRLRQHQVTQTLRSKQHSELMGVEAGDLVTLFLDGREVGLARVTSKELVGFSSLVLSDAQRGGFDSLDELEDALKRAGFRFQPIEEYHLVRFRFSWETASQWLRLKDRLHAIYGAWDCYRQDPAFRQRLGYFGCLIGEVTITGCVKKIDDSISLIGNFWPKAEESYESPWFFGPYGYTLTDPVRYDKGIPCKGHLGFFEVSV